jgi:hypothetical protein
MVPQDESKHAIADASLMEGGLGSTPQCSLHCFSQNHGCEERRQLGSASPPPTVEVVQLEKPSLGRTQKVSVVKVLGPDARTLESPGLSL